MTNKKTYRRFLICA